MLYAAQGTLGSEATSHACNAQKTHVLCIWEQQAANDS